MLSQKLVLNTTSSGPKTNAKERGILPLQCQRAGRERAWYHVTQRPLTTQSGPDWLTLLGGLRGSSLRLSRR